MKKAALVLALAIASLNSAHAQADAPVAPVAQKQMRFLAGAGLTVGGDKLMTVKYENGTDMAIRAGGMIALNAGIDYRMTEKFSFQATVGYHVDSTSARNADARFERYPIELLAYYQVSPQWRIGGGVRYVSNPKIKTSGVLNIGDVAFDNTVGGVIEAEYLMNENLGIKMRYVNEKYEGKEVVGKIDGQHVGVFAIFYF
jgi:hypothetical protein